MEAVPSVGGDSPVLLLDDVHKLYNPGPLQVHVLKGVSLSVDEGDYVAIMGHSGSGKSTMLNVLGCLDIPTSGRYLISGVDVSELDDNQLAQVRNRY
ncbi:MAG: putative transport system ATP-binding protein, partial [Actinomycetota bacterium]|nr:putative transport system ATP-binding protein [Actinomycetota bacterium]